VNNAGVALDWFMSAFGVRGHGELEKLARSALADEFIPLVFPYLTGERDPRIGSRARGMVAGLRADHDRGALALATLEGTAFSLKFIQDALADNGITVKRIRAGGGGVRLATWTSLIASILGRPLSASQSGQPGLVGSGMLGWTAIGEFAGIAEASRRMSGTSRRVIPLKGGGRASRFTRYRDARAHISSAGLFSA